MPFLKKILLTSEKVTTSEEVYKGAKILIDIKEEVVTIRWKDLDNFRGSLNDQQVGLILIMSLKKKVFYT